MMQTIFRTFTLLSALCLSLAVQGEDFKPLFNGRDLSGWQRINTHQSTWTIRDGMLVCTGKPIGELRTTRMYQNFVLELEWRHLKPKGNAGIFVWADDITAKGVPFHRSIEVQVLENAYGNSRGHTTHGDIFPIHGAKMEPINGRGGSRAFPVEERSLPSPQWNHYRIECRDGDISLAVNGKVVTKGRNCSPRKGYICIESEGGVVHYRNVRIRELPDTTIDPQHIAQPERGFRCLYEGIDLSAWDVRGNWQAQDWKLKYRGNQEGEITSKTELGDCHFIFDFRYIEDEANVTVALGGQHVLSSNEATTNAALAPSGKWSRVEGWRNQSRLEVKVNGKSVASESISANSPPAPLRIKADRPVEFANIYVRDLH